MTKDQAGLFEGVGVKKSTPRYHYRNCSPPAGKPRGYRAIISVI
jgi:hypothetical protein